MNYAKIVDKKVSKPKNVRVFEQYDLYPGQNRFGYGTRIATDMIVKIERSNHWHRVYTNNTVNDLPVFVNTNTGVVFVKAEDVFGNLIDI